MMTPCLDGLVIDYGTRLANYIVVTVKHMKPIFVECVETRELEPEGWEMDPFHT
jgi:hypothetical protein